MDSKPRIRKQPSTMGNIKWCLYVCVLMCREMRLWELDYAVQVFLRISIHNFDDSSWPSSSLSPKQETFVLCPYTQYRYRSNSLSLYSLLSLWVVLPCKPTLRDLKLCVMMSPLSNFIFILKRQKNEERKLHSLPWTNRGDFGIYLLL